MKRMFQIERNINNRVHKMLIGKLCLQEAMKGKLYQMRIKKWINSKFHKVKLCDKILWKNYLSTVAIVSSVITIVAFILPEKCDCIKNIMAIGFGIYLIGCFFYMWNDANQISEAKLHINNTKENVLIGDIFDLMKKSDEEKKNEISVIAVNNYYDLIVDDKIISKQSLHGKYVQRIIKAGKIEALNSCIRNDKILNKVENVESISCKRENGQNVCYKIGTVVEFESYVLTAFSKFDSNNKAYLTAEEYMSFWMNFWDNIDRIYAGRTINLPLIGAGITRFRHGKPTKQELLETMLWSLRITGFHNTYGNREINILIHSADASDIDFYHIQHNASFQ